MFLLFEICHLLLFFPALLKTVLSYANASSLFIFESLSHTSLGARRVFQEIAVLFDDYPNMGLFPGSLPLATASDMVLA